MVARILSASDCGIIFEYREGELYWRERDPSWFANGQAFKAFNTRFAGKRACTIIHGRNGQKRYAARFGGKLYLRSRIVLALRHGKWPECGDHINGDSTDDRIENLRDVDHTTNHRNRKRPANNTSGRIGVTWRRSESKWIAQIRVCGKTRILGAFQDFQEAVDARRAAESSLGFHENHGRAA